MKKEFTANILFLLSINLIVKPFYALAVDTTVQNTVGPEVYGLYLALFNFIYIQQIFSDLGLQNFNNREVSMNPGNLNKLISRTLTSKILYSVFFLIIVIANVYIFDYSEYLDGILIWIISSQLSLSFLLFLRTNISGSGRYFVDSMFSVMDKALLIFILAYLLWINPPNGGFTIIHFVQAQFASLFSSAIICALYTHLKLIKISLTFDFNYIKKLLLKSLPYASLVLLMGAYSRLDSIMLEKLISDNALEAGKYAASFRLFDTYNNFSFLFAVLLYPMFSKMISKGQKVHSLVHWTLRLMSISSIYLIIISYFFGEEILGIFYKANLDISYTGSFFYLMLAAFAVSLNYIYGSLLTANGNLKLLNIIALGGFVVNLILNFLLIPKIGAVGAAITTAVTQILVLIFQVLFSLKYFSLGFPGNTILKLLIYFMLIVLFIIVMEQYTSRNYGMIITSSAVLSIILSFGLKLLKKHDFKVIDQIKLHSKS